MILFRFLSVCWWILRSRTCACWSGVTLVVTPLVSLMEDQVMYLESISVPAAMLNASSSKVKLCFYRIHLVMSDIPILSNS